jgi:hypothetical protein
MDLSELRSFFLNKLSQKVASISTELSVICDLYKTVELFYYEANKKRLQKFGKKGYLNWHRYNRPPWDVVERAWRSRSEDLEISFDSYYAEGDKWGVWTYPVYQMPAHRGSDLSQAVEGIFRWSEAVSLDAEWCRRYAYETLDLWCREPDYRGKRIWQCLPYSLPITLSEVGIIHLSFPEMSIQYPVTFSKAELIAELKKHIYEALEKEIDDSLSRARLRTAVDKRKLMTKYNLDHFDWLIDYQFRGKSFKEIARADSVDDSQNKESIPDDTKKVRKAVNQLAKLLELPIRHDVNKVGRPPKKSRN